MYRWYTRLAIFVGLVHFGFIPTWAQTQLLHLCDNLKTTKKGKLVFVA
jgi:hypothetical protein